MTESRSSTAAAIKPAPRARTRIRQQSPTSIPAQNTAGTARKVDTGIVGFSAEERRERIAKEAYYLAERRNFESGHEVEDWLAAELLVDALLSRSNTGESAPS